jgi:hypothetical protein
MVLLKLVVFCGDLLKPFLDRFQVRRESNCQIGGTHDPPVDVSVDLFLRPLYIEWIVPIEIRKTKIGAYRTKPGFICQKMFVVKSLNLLDLGSTT